jgi:hypothetical protein
MKPRLRNLVRARKEALRKASPKSRDRLRYRLMVIEKVAQIKRELRA